MIAEQSAQDMAEVMQMQQERLRSQGIVDEAVRSSLLLMLLGLYILTTWFVCQNSWRRDTTQQPVTCRTVIATALCPVQP